MDDLIAWLTAQIDEDERYLDISNYTVRNGACDVPTHWDEDRCLQEVAARRLRLAVIERELADDPTDETARYLLQIEALPYADWPGYREEWKP